MFFFQQFWSFIGREVSNFCISYIANGPFPQQLNETLLVLIPKKTSPESMMDLHPIALCQVLYKIISRMLSNRLKPLLSFIIFPQQSAFVAGRQIQDNSIIAYKVLHYLRSKKLGKTGMAALKIDISKAYDKFEWTFLRDVMLHMVFCEAWTYMVQYCVSTVSYKVLQQVQILGPIQPARGLRQSDPLSLYLFILCAEVLSRIIQAWV